jgi:hypothetical protein
MPSVNFAPNIDTPEKAERANELVKEQEKAHDAIVRFMNCNEQAIARALQFAMDKDAISDEEDFDEGNILDAFKAHMNEWRDACNRSIGFIATGKEQD